MTHHIPHHRDNNRLALARQMLYQLPEWGEWARTHRQYDTPFGSVTLTQAALLYALRVQLMNRPPTLELISRHFKRTPEEINSVAAPLCEQQLVTFAPLEDAGDAPVFQLTPLGLEASHWVADHHTYQIASELDTLDDPTIEHLGNVLDLLDSILIRLKEGE